MRYFKLIIVGIVLFLIVNPSIATDEDAKMTKKARQLFFNTVSGEREKLIFSDSNGNRFRQPSKIFTPVIDSLGLNEGVTDRRRKLTFHSLRHTYGAWHVDRGTPLYDLQRLIRHSTPELTRDTPIFPIKD